MSKPLQKIARPQQLSITMLLLHKQGGICPLCGERINVGTQGRGSDYALDHCHTTGEVRGVLHRACNSAEGKVRHAVSRWGGCGKDEDKIITWIIALGQYLQDVKEGKRSTGLMYPNHKTPEQANEAARVKRNKQAAAKRAKERAAKLKAKQG
ncbi:MAG: hypothetical protein [Bacteriophage sp.]|nr:MAG: hypothetical protein [Bacteriophage sp.]